jgi:hypothetical protein
MPNAGYCDASLRILSACETLSPPPFYPGTTRPFAASPKVSTRERAFNRLPILADALLDAGCDDEELIQHCRTEGPHVRGCWVIDLILSKDR